MSRRVYTRVLSLSQDLRVIVVGDLKNSIKYGLCPQGSIRRPRVKRAMRQNAIWWDSAILGATGESGHEAAPRASESPEPSPTVSGCHGRDAGVTE